MPRLVSFEVHNNSASLLDFAVIDCFPEYWSMKPRPPMPTTTPDWDFPSWLIPYDASQYTTACIGPSPGVMRKPLCPDPCDWCKYRMRIYELVDEIMGSYTSTLVLWLRESQKDKRVQERDLFGIDKFRKCTIFADARKSFHFYEQGRIPTFL